jgi:diguanylate cyclase (GGDEF)-like protein
VDIRHYFRVIIKGWWLILSAFVISVVTGLIFTYSQTPIYRSQATFVVSPSASLSEFNEYMRSLDGINKRDSFVGTTYGEIATSRIVLGTVYSQLGLTPAQIQNLSVSAELIDSTNIIEVTVESDDPLIAKSVADSVGQQTIEYVKNLLEPYDMKPLDPAFVPTSPSKPLLARNLLVAAMFGVLVGLASAFLLENLRSSQEVTGGVNIIDQDTGVYNRYYFMQRLGEELSRAKRQNNPLSLALMNIEHLDALGDMRLPGQRVEALRRVALFLKRHLREEDLIAHFEDERFAFLLPDTSGEEAKQILEKLQDRLELNVFELGEKDGTKLNLSATSGVASYHFNGAGREELLSHTQEALRRAGDNGRGGIFLYNGDRHSTVSDEMNPDRPGT